MSQSWLLLHIVLFFFLSILSPPISVNTMAGTGETASSLKGIPVVVPPNLKFNQISRYPNVTRTQKILRPRDNSNSTNGNNIIRFDLPSETMDLREGYLKATVAISKVGGTYARLAQGGATSCVDYMRCFCGPYEDRVQNYGRTMSMIWNSSVDPFVQSTLGVDLFGYGTQADRNAAGAVPSEYMMLLRCGLLNQGFLPLKNLCTPSNGQTFSLEIVLDNASSFVETDGGSPEVTFSNVQLVYDQLTGATDVNGRDMFEQAIQREIEGGNLILGYRNWQCLQNPVINSNNDILINSKVSSLNAIVSTIVDGSNLNNPLTNDKYITWPKVFGNGASVQNFQHQINNTWTPPEPLNSQGLALRPYQAYTKYLGIWDSKGKFAFPAPIDVDSFNNDQFLIVGDFYASARSVWRMQEEEYQFNDLNLQSSSTTPMLRVEFNIAPPAQTVIYHFISYNVTVRVDRRGIMTRQQ
jgi:hypothetical protein